MPDIVTPKILQNVPVGKDEFASQSQEHYNGPLVKTTF